MLVVLSMLLSAPVWAAEKNPFEPDDFIKMSKEQDKNDLISKKPQLQEDYDKKKNAFQKKKLEIIAQVELELAKQYGSDSWDNIKSFFSGFGNSVKGVFTLDFDKWWDAQKQQAGAIADQFKDSFRTQANNVQFIANIGLGMFANDKLDASNLKSMLEKNYPGNTKLSGLADELYALGKETYKLEKELQAIDDIKETNQEVYAYVTPDNQTILFKKVEYAFQSAGEFMFGKRLHAAAGQAGRKPQLYFLSSVFDNL